MLEEALAGRILAARIVTASGAADDWREVMQREARSVLEGWDADLAVVGLVKQPGEALGVWFVPRSGEGTLTRGDEPYELDNATLGPDFRDDFHAELTAVARSGRPGSLLTLAPHRSGRAGSAASGSSTDSFATRRRVPAGPGSQAMATAIPKACLASSAIRCRDVETGPNLGVLAVFPSNGATCRCLLPSTGSRGLNSPASAVL